MEASNPAHNGSRAFTAEGSVRREGGPAAEVSTFCSCGVAVSPAEAACGGGAHTEVPLMSPSPAAATGLCHGLGGATASAGHGWTTSGRKKETASIAFPNDCGTGRARRKREAHAGAFPSGSRGSCFVFPSLANGRDVKELLMGMQERPCALQETLCQ